MFKKKILIQGRIYLAKIQIIFPSFFICFSSGYILAWKP